jgi:hypothetical protein
MDIRKHGFTDQDIEKVDIEGEEVDVDIEDYEFSDADILCVKVKFNDYVEFKFSDEDHYALGFAYLWLDKEDVIALAKHFKLTEEDLK